jgi:hypothetical protein
MDSSNRKVVALLLAGLKWRHGTTTANLFLLVKVGKAKKHGAGRQCP